MIMSIVRGDIFFNHWKPILWNKIKISQPKQFEQDCTVGKSEQVKLELVQIHSEPKLYRSNQEWNRENCTECIRSLNTLKANITICSIGETRSRDTFPWSSNCWFRKMRRVRGIDSRHLLREHFIQIVSQLALRSSRGKVTEVGKGWSCTHKKVKTRRNY